MYMYRQKAGIVFFFTGESFVPCCHLARGLFLALLRECVVDFPKKVQGDKFNLQVRS